MRNRESTRRKHRPSRGASIAADDRGRARVRSASGRVGGILNDDARGCGPPCAPRPSEPPDPSSALRVAPPTSGRSRCASVPKRAPVGRPPDGKPRHVPRGEARSTLRATGATKSDANRRGRPHCRAARVDGWRPIPSGAAEGRPRRAAPSRGRSRSPASSSARRACRRGCDGTPRGRTRPPGSRTISLPVCRVERARASSSPASRFSPGLSGPTARATGVPRRHACSRDSAGPERDRRRGNARREERRRVVAGAAEFAVIATARGSFRSVGRQNLQVRQSNSYFDSAGTWSGPTRPGRMSA